MAFRWSTRKSLGRGFFVGLSRSGPSVGRRGKRGSVSVSRRGLSGSVRVFRGLSYIFRRR